MGHFWAFSATQPLRVNEADEASRVMIIFARNNSAVLVQRLLGTGRWAQVVQQRFVCEFFGDPLTDWPCREVQRSEGEEKW